MQKFSLRIHTTGYDGKNTIEEMIKQAKKLDWEALGISNHIVFHENMPLFLFYLLRAAVVSLAFLRLKSCLLPHQTRRTESSTVLYSFLLFHFPFKKLLFKKEFLKKEIF